MAGARSRHSAAHADSVDGFECWDGAADDEEDDFDAGPHEERESLPVDVAASVEADEFGRLDCGAYARPNKIRSAWVLVHHH